MAPIRSPIACIMYLTNRCDGNCWYCTVRSTVRNRFARGIDADYEKVILRLIEFKNLGGRFVELTGGNPLLMDWLPKVLALCNELGLVSSLSLCGPQINKRFTDWGKQWIKLPSIIRFSVDGSKSRQNQIRGKGFYASILEGLKASKGRRLTESTQLAFILVPGEKGNIIRNQLKSVLKLANQHCAKVNLYPLFGTTFSRTKERSDRLWMNISGREVSVLHWLQDQPEIMDQSRDKIDFILSGGNKTDKPTCLAGRTVISIAPSDRIISPCYHNPNAVHIGEKGLKAALDSTENCENACQSGELPGCNKCNVWCNDPMGRLSQSPYMLDYVFSGM